MVRIRRRRRARCPPFAKVYLLKWHVEGQLPYASLVRRQPHADSVVQQAESWLAEHYREPHVVAAVVKHCAIPERSLKRRFTTATGSSLITYVQNQVECCSHAD